MLLEIRTVCAILAVLSLVIAASARQDKGVQVDESLEEKVNQLFTLEQVLDAVEMVINKLHKGTGNDNKNGAWQLDQSPSTQSVTTPTSTSSRSVTATTPSKATPTMTASTSTTPPSTTTQTATELNNSAEGLNEASNELSEDPKRLNDEPTVLNKKPTSIEDVLKIIEMALQEIENPKKNTSDLIDEIASYHSGSFDRVDTTTHVTTSLPVDTRRSQLPHSEPQTQHPRKSRLQKPQKVIEVINRIRRTNNSRY